MTGSDDQRPNAGGEIRTEIEKGELLCAILTEIKSVGSIFVA
jgi:hypothetical protein